MKHVVAWLAWWLGLFWLWLLLAGEWNREEWVAAAVAAAIGASVGELARVRTGFTARIPARLLADVPRVIGMVVVDFGIVVWALFASVVRRRILRGELISRDLSRRSSAARGVGPRAGTALLASYSPNAFVIDIDPETRHVLLHDLVPNRSSENPA